MYVRVAGMSYQPEVLIKDPSVYCFNIEEKGQCEVAIENEYLLVKTQSNVDDFHELMRNMEKLKNDQKEGSPSDTVFFEARGILLVVSSQKEVFGQMTTMIRTVAMCTERMQRQFVRQEKNIPGK